MTATTITVPRELLFDATAWLFAFDELFAATEDISPCVLERDLFDVGYDWKTVAHDLMDRLAGGNLADLDDDDHDRHPVLVELFARAREHAAGMLRLAEREESNGRYPLTLAGDQWTAKGFRLIADRVASDAKRTRELGVIYPPAEVPADAC